MEANRRFTERGLQVSDSIYDPRILVSDVKASVKSSRDDLAAKLQLSSVREMLGVYLRIHSFRTTFLISPEGNILSMSRSERDEPALRGRDLLTTLDKILPKQ
jgi:hypothetical protein